MGQFYPDCGNLSTTIANMGKARPVLGKTNFSRWLEREMRRAGMKQSELSRATGIGTSTISRWLDDTVPQRQDYLDRLATVFGVDEDEVLIAAGYRSAVDWAEEDDQKRRLISMLRRANLKRGTRAQELEATLKLWLDWDRTHPDADD